MSALDTGDYPHEYRCIDIPAHGGPEVLLLSTRPMPQPKSQEVLIRVKAIGVNRADIKQRLGIYHMPSDAPSVPGLEVAGVVAACGVDVVRWKLGDRVCALVIGGGYAEYCIAPDVQCLPIPESLNFVQAAALPEALFTVWSSLIEQASLQPGEVVLVHGGASGIGTTAIQLAHTFGARVLATAGSTEKCKLSERLGAEHSINYRIGDFSEQARAYIGERGVDVVLDMVGSDYLERHIELLSTGGRLCFISAEHGRQATIDIMKIQLKRIYLTGSTLRHRSASEKGRIAQILERKVWPLVGQGRIRPVIWKTFPLTAAAQAHYELESGNVLGKLVLVPA